MGGIRWAGFDGAGMGRKRRGMGTRDATSTSRFLLSRSERFSRLERRFPMRPMQDARRDVHASADAEKS